MKENSELRSIVVDTDEEGAIILGKNLLKVESKKPEPDPNSSVIFTEEEVLNIFHLAYTNSNESISIALDKCLVIRNKKPVFMALFYTSDPSLFFFSLGRCIESNYTKEVKDLVQKVIDNHLVSLLEDFVIMLPVERTEDDPIVQFVAKVHTNLNVKRTSKDIN